MKFVSPDVLHKALEGSVTSLQNKAEEFVKGLGGDVELIEAFVDGCLVLQDGEFCRLTYDGGRSVLESVDDSSLPEWRARVSRELAVKLISGGIGDVEVSQFMALVQT